MEDRHVRKHLPFFEPTSVPETCEGAAGNPHIFGRVKVRVPQLVVVLGRDGPWAIDGPWKIPWKLVGCRPYRHHFDQETWQCYAILLLSLLSLLVLFWVYSMSK